MNPYHVRWTKGSGPGGQHKNKVANCCVLTHIPTGIVVTVDGRSRRQNERDARRLMDVKLAELKEEALAERKKSDRDRKIKDSFRVRTYDYIKGIVIDHRTGKRATIKDVVVKGLLGKLR